MVTEPVVLIPEDTKPLPQGTRLGKYEIVRRLGAGGMGVVYEALHSQIGKRVAVKVLAPAVAAMPGARARFLREAQLTSKVDHPHAVDVMDIGAEGDHAFLVMELLSGEDLATHLAGVGRLDPMDLVDIVLPICSAVVAAHGVGITHRDLKPQNIFLAKGAHGSVPKVLDFGISRWQDAPTSSTLTSTGAVLGTPYYLAPEQVVDNRASGPASDQYAIGIILYQCLTGVRPFDADSLFLIFQAIVAGSPVRPREHRPELDPALEAVVLRAIEVEPTRRFPTVEDLGRALWPFAGERGRLLWRDAFGPPGAGKKRPIRTPMPAETAADPRSQVFTPSRRPVTPDSRSFGSGTMKKKALGGGFLGVLTVLGVLAVLAVGGGVVWFQRSGGVDQPDRESAALSDEASKPTVARPNPPPLTFNASVTVEPATARIEVDDKAAGTSPFNRIFAADGVSHTLVVSADGFETYTVTFRDAPPPTRISLVSRSAKDAPPSALTDSDGRRGPKARNKKRTFRPGTEDRARQVVNPDDAPVID